MKHLEKCKLLLLNTSTTTLCSYKINAHVKSAFSRKKLLFFIPNVLYKNANLQKLMTIWSLI